MNQLPGTGPVRSIVKFLELFGLLVILVATLFAAGTDVLEMAAMREVNLSDLLLLFLYLEVLAMVAVYMESGKLPVRFPIYIAIIALARYLIIEVKDLDTWKMLAVGLTMLVLAATVLVVRYGHLRFPYPPDDK